MQRLYFIIFFVALCLTGLLGWYGLFMDKTVFLKPVSYTEQSSRYAEDWLALIPPEVLFVSPVDQAKEVLIGIEDPIIVHFKSSAKPFFIDFSFEPPVEAVYENNEEKTEFRILPKTPLVDAQTYTMIVSYHNRDATQTEATEIYRSSFTTLPAAPESWSADLAERLLEARKFTRPSIISGKYIDINLKSQVMTLFENGRLVDAFIVSSGLPGMDTPKGEHAIYNKSPRTWSKRYGLYMPYWMAITPDGKYGLHELPEWPGGYKEGANHLGRPVSHGCVRLGVGPAKILYDWSEIGTPVIVH